MVTRVETGKGGGMVFERPTSTLKAPFEGREKEEGLSTELPAQGAVAPEERVMAEGKVPLHPGVITLPFSILGRVGTELTGYPGFVFTEFELNTLAELWIQCGIMMSPMLQASIGTTSMVGGKALGYFAWVKMGKPPIPGASTIGKETAELKEEEE